MKNNYKLLFSFNLHTLHNKISIFKLFNKALKNMRDNITYKTIV